MARGPEVPEQAVGGRADRRVRVLAGRGRHAGHGDNSAEGASSAASTGRVTPGSSSRSVRRTGGTIDYDPLPPLTGPTVGRTRRTCSPACPARPSSSPTNAERDRAAEAHRDHRLHLRLGGPPQGRVRRRKHRLGVRRGGRHRLGRDPRTCLEDPGDRAEGEENEADYNGNWGAMAQYASTAEFRNSQVQPLDIYTVEGYERRLFEATKLYDGMDSPTHLPVLEPLGPGRGRHRALHAADQHRELRARQSTAEFITGVRDPTTTPRGRLPGRTPGHRSRPLRRDLAGRLRRELSSRSPTAPRRPGVAGPCRLSRDSGRPL